MIVLEIQKIEGNAATLVFSFENSADAEAQYHRVLAAAAVSDVPVHSAVLMYDNGVTVKRETYMHGGKEDTD